MAYGKRGKDKSGFYKDIRDKGFYLSINEHNPSLFAIAVPVISKSNIFVGALVASGPISRFNENKRRLLLNNLRSNLAKVVIP
jgi:DNA-binding IclR family transcriptional regulator